MRWVWARFRDSKTSASWSLLHRTMPLGRASDFNTLIVYNLACHGSHTPHERQKVTGLNPCIPPHSILTCAVSTLTKPGVHNEGNCLTPGDFYAMAHHTCTVFIEVSSHAPSLSIQFGNGVLTH